MTISTIARAIDPVVAVRDVPAPDAIEGLAEALTLDNASGRGRRRDIAIALRTVARTLRQPPAAPVAVRERPILFTSAMVQAILAGRKTQTRRLVTAAPGRQREWMTADLIGASPSLALAVVDGEKGVQLAHPKGGPLGWIPCPYGAPGDRLYVRETWAAAHEFDHLKPSEIPRGTRIHYAASERGGLLWRPSIFLPRWASRIELEVARVHVERLHAISELEALAEGVEGERVSSVLNGVRGEYIVGSARDSFAALWDGINGERAAWASDPWVWVIEFKRAERAAGVSAP